jgi:peptidoglycan/xylan/chitin deacetylase (PgdA/CDA1 family)
MSAVKSAATTVAALRGPRALLRPTLRGRAVIFVLHRFRDVNKGIRGHDPAVMRRFLEVVRRARYEVLSLTELFRRLREGEPHLRGAITFTIDDGYLEQATVAGPLFAEFDCPVTTFVTTGFLDGEIWLWWDQIEYILRRAPRRAVQFELGSTTVTYDLADDTVRERARTDLVARCKEMDDLTMRRVVARLADTVEVPLPAKPPAEYAPMTWDQLRECERCGMAFGAHSVTHPILSQATQEESERELALSWERIRAEAAQPVPVFCYPNGRAADAGPRETRVLADLGFWGAVLAEPGYVRAAQIRKDGKAIYRVPRFAFPENVPKAMQCVSGLERVREVLRLGEHAPT